MTQKADVAFMDEGNSSTSLLRLFRQHAALCSTNNHDPYSKQAAPGTFFPLRNRIGTMPDPAARLRAWEIVERLVDRARTKAAPNAGI